MADKLIVIENYGFYRIVWELDDGVDIGAYLGDSPVDLGKGPPKKRDDAECYFSEKEAEVIFKKAEDEGDDSVIKDHYGYGWESLKDAEAALKRINAAIKVGLDKRPWPEWAQEALKHGWKPPKGWQP